MTSEVLPFSVGSGHGRCIIHELFINKLTPDLLTRFGIGSVLVLESREPRGPALLPINGSVLVLESREPLGPSLLPIHGLRSTPSVSNTG